MSLSSRLKIPAPLRKVLRYVKLHWIKTRFGIETIEITHLTYTQVAGEQVAVGYLNLYICNDGVIVPTAGHEFDEEALAIIGDAFPGRSIVPVPGATIAYGGGGPHCITQQVPAI